MTSIRDIIFISTKKFTRLSQLLGSAAEYVAIKIQGFDEIHAIQVNRKYFVQSIEKKKFKK